MEGFPPGGVQAVGGGLGVKFLVVFGLWTWSRIPEEPIGRDVELSHILG